MDLVLASRVLPRYIPHQAMDFGKEKQRSAGFLAMVPPVEWQRTVLCVRICIVMLHTLKLISATWWVDQRSKSNHLSPCSSGEKASAYIASQK